ncbi:transposase family protein [Tessaracoccus sp.]|uniref:transposase family protein n=1 Tax=Tessaracoccus sp. TaxID=1971211 RepID=UPI0026079702|nr:transposase family protein [Tessaracoccus sp.]
MKNSTGLTRSLFTELMTILNTTDLKHAVPPILGLAASVKITLKYLRRNRTQADIADDHDLSQPTISRAITTVTPVLAHALADLIPTAEDLSTGIAYLIDGSLLPCWSWTDTSELYSGKHHTTGVNVQVATSLEGRILWVSDPLPGSTHDVIALDTHGLLDGHDPTQFIADKGYIGRGMTTPVKKPIGRELTENDKEYNKTVNQLRWPVEQAISHLKNWRILHTIPTTDAPSTPSPQQSPRSSGSTS